MRIVFWQTIPTKYHTLFSVVIVALRLQATSLFLAVLNLDPKCAFNLKIKICTSLILSREGMN